MENQVGNDPTVRASIRKLRLERISRRVAARPSAPSDASRVRARSPEDVGAHRGSLPLRVGEALYGFGESALTRPVETIAGIVKAPFESFEKAVSPLSKQPSRPWERRQFDESDLLTFPISDLPPVTKKEKLLGAAQTAANVAAPFLGKAGGALASRVGATGGMKSAASAVASLSPVGAAYMPEDPLVGAITMPIVGKAIERGFGAAGKAAKGIKESVSKLRAEHAAAPSLEVPKQAQPPVRPVEPPTPEAATPVPPAPEIVQPAPAPAAREATPAAGIAEIPTESIAVDPQRFQFKQGMGEAGAGKELRGVERYRPELAGVLSVWKDPANGLTYVVNGHHRLELARRAGQPSVRVQYLEAPTAEAARASGALINIAEGRGTAVDAAKFFRDSGYGPDELSAQGVSLRGDVAAKGVALSGLAPDVFDQVASGKLPEASGVVIGRELGGQPELQRSVLGLASSSKRTLSTAELTELARQVKSAGSESVTQESLFGTETEAVSLAVPRARVAAAIAERLRKDKSTFGFVSKGTRAEELARAGNVIDVQGSRAVATEAAQLAEAFDREAHASGPIARQLTEAARRLVRGEKLDAILESIYEPVRSGLQSTLARGTPTGAPEPAAGGTVGSGAAPGLAGPELALGRPAEAGKPTDPLAQTNELLRQGEERLKRRQEILDFEERRKAGTQFEEAPVEEPLARPRAAASAEPSLFAEERTAPSATQESLFGAKEGTAGARPLEAAIRASEAIIPKLREQLRLAKESAQRQKIAAQLKEHLSIANHGKSITAEEVKAEIEATGDRDTPQVTGQVDLFSPMSQPSRIGQILRRAVGLSKNASNSVMTLEQIGRDMAKSLDAAFGGGRFKRRAPKARGVFFRFSEDVRAGRKDWLDTVAHEIGHYVSKKYLKNPTAPGARNNLPPAAVAELEAFGQQLYKGKRAASGYGEEGIAEWFSFYVTEHARLATEAPVFTRWMDDVFKKEPTLKHVMDLAHERFETWTAAGPEARADAMLSVGERPRWQVSVRGFKRAVLQDLEPIQNAEKVLEEIGSTRGIGEKASTYAKLTRGTVGMADEMMERGITLPGTTARVTRPMLGAYELIGTKRFQKWRRYLMSHRTIEKAAQGKDSGQATIDAEAIIKKLDAESPDYLKASEIMWENSLALLELKEVVGMITPEQHAMLAKANQRRVGFYRDIDVSEGVTSSGFGGGMVKTSGGIKSFKGSGRRILDPLETMMRDVYDTVRVTQEWITASEMLHQALSTEGGAKVARVVDTPLEKVLIHTDVARRQIIEMLNDMGVQVELTAPDAATMQVLLDKWPGMIEGWRDRKYTTGAEGKDLVFPRLKPGTNEWQWIQVNDKALFEAMTQRLGPPGMNALQRIISGPTRLMRTTATLTTEFIARNLFRDIGASAVYSRQPLLSPASIPGYLSLEGLFHLVGKTERYKRWRLSGGEQAALAGLDRPSLQKTLREAMLTPMGKALDIGRHPIASLRRASNFVEQLPRIGEYAGMERLLERRTGRKAESSLDIRQEAGLASRELTLDFAQSGWAAREGNRIIGFLNAVIQGDVKFLSELRRRPHIVIPRALATITVPAIWLYLKQRNDPDYQNLPQWRKDLFYNIITRNEDGSLKRIITIPKSFELGILFGTLPERILTWMDTDDPKAMDGLATRMADALLPDWKPNWLLPAIEADHNYSSFRDRPIESEALQRLPKADRAYGYTGEAARIAGAVTGQSPAKIEHLVKGYMPGLGGVALGAADVGIRELRDLMGAEPLRPKAAEEPDWMMKIPGLKGLIARRPGRDGATVTRFYQRFEAAEQLRNHWKRMEDGPRKQQYLTMHPEIKALATKTDDGASGVLRQVRTQIDRMQLVRRELERTQLASNERRAQLEKLDEQIITLARQALVAIGDGQALYDELSSRGLRGDKLKRAQRQISRRLKAPR